MKHLAAFFFACCMLLSARAASAQERDDDVPVKRSLVEGFGEGGIGIRSVDLTGMTLMTPGVSADKPRMAIRGEDISVFALATMSIGAGVRVGPVVGGIDIGAGLGGGASTPTRRVGDIDVAPTGFAGAMITSAYLGVMIDQRDYRLRLDAVLGSELIGLGMSRPGYDDTSVSAINQSRWTLGPRVRIDFPFGHRQGPAAGFVVGCDARSPANLTFGIVVTSL